MEIPNYKHKNYDKIAGCLFGGAISDALGGAVEFSSLDEIRSEYGSNGITDYSPSYGRLGAITDDTQMTLFTAEGLIRAAVRQEYRGICAPESVIYYSYLRWLVTQGYKPSKEFEIDGWLMTNKELFHRRSPGKTCLSSLQYTEHYGHFEPNNSKGCGTIMRVAPIGLICEDPFGLAFETSRITHAHPTAQIAAGSFAYLISILHEDANLLEAMEEMYQRCLFEEKERDSTAETSLAINHALELFKRTDKPSAEDVETLGGGWIAEEALAISIFCALQADYFETGICLAVNHSGDSDSTGSMTGQVLGAWNGLSEIDHQWLDRLELKSPIQQVAKDLCFEDMRELLERYPGW